MSMTNIVRIVREIPGEGYLVQLEGNRRTIVNPGFLTVAERAAFVPPPQMKGKKTNIGDPMKHGVNPAANSYKNKR